MHTNRLNLSNPAMAKRIRKYDTYVHQSGRTARRMDIVPTKPNTKNLTSNTVPKKPIHQKKSYKTLRTDYQTAKIQNTKLPTNDQQYNNDNNYNPRQIAVNSVADSKEQVSQNGAIKSQFSDEGQVQYTKPNYKTSGLQKVFYGIGVMVFLMSTFASVNTIMANNFAKEKVATLSAQTSIEQEGSGSEPSEAPVSLDDVTSYQVSNPEDPRYIRIPDLKIFARIKNLGVNEKGAIDAPWNIYDTGWYNGSVRPGNGRGTSLILGHVSSWTSDGIFKNLNNLKTGSKITIEKGSGEEINYQVTKLEEIALNDIDMAKVLTPDNPNAHDIKLMTCSGSFNRETDTFENRLIVHAERI